jgi:hypothetical protein
MRAIPIPINKSDFIKTFGIVQKEFSGAKAYRQVIVPKEIKTTDDCIKFLNESNVTIAVLPPQIYSGELPRFFSECHIEDATDIMVPEVIEAGERTFKGIMERL